MISLDWAIIALRFLQFGGAVILFGSPLFLLYGRLLPPDVKPAGLVWAKTLLLRASLILLIATPLQFLIQTANLAGSFAGVCEADAFKAALLDMSFGKSSLARCLLAFVAFVLTIVFPADRRLFSHTAIVGALICASFAWMGHGAATEGSIDWVHLGADIAHSLAAAGWLGALAIFWIGTRKHPPSSVTTSNLATSLAAFSGVGTLIVAVIVTTGLINSFFLIGWDAPKALSLPYGQLLAVKLAFFLGMLCLAAANRYWHTPALSRALEGQDDHESAIAILRKSIRTEALFAMAVLAVVAWLGTLAPVTAQ